MTAGRDAAGIAASGPAGALNAPHLVALSAPASRFEEGTLVEHPDESAADMPRVAPGRTRRK